MYSGSGDIDDSLKQEASLGVDVDHLTSDAPETLRDLNVHRQLQAERMMSSIKIISNFTDYQLIQ